MIEPLDEVVDHVRGPAAGTVILEYGNYQCPYSRRAFRNIERVVSRLGGVHGTPTIFIDGVIYGGSYLVPSLEQALTELGSPR